MLCSPRMSLTPIRIRGKRTGIKAEKWQAGKKRKASRIHTYEPLGLERSDGAALSRKRKRLNRALAPVEGLPTEILQDIFYFSENLNLALASLSLQSQLSSRHVYFSYTARVLSAVLRGLGGGQASTEEVAKASRLFACKFFTWDFFKLWLEQHDDQADTDLTAQSDSPSQYYSALWQRLDPSPGLVPPFKVLHGPWTDDKIAFLSVVADSRADLATLSPVHSESAYAGLSQAITEGSQSAVYQLLKLKLIPDTELVRQAVIDEGCEQGIVSALVSRALEHCQDSIDPEREYAEYQSQAVCSIDFLDPALWAWAQKARSRGDGKGQWLRSLLKAQNQQLQELDRRRFETVPVAEN